MGTGYATYAAGTHTVYLTAVSGKTTIAFWANNNGGTFNLSAVSLVRAGEVAAYTPQSINDKWYDTTSNENNGTISGATTVGDTDHFGVLTVKGRSEAGNDNRNYAGCILLGNGATNEQGRFDFDPVSNTSLRIDNTTNNDSAEIEFGLKAAGTRVIPMQLLGDGTVKARSAASTNLKQVARISDYTLNGNGSATSFTVTHNLGTADIVVSVRSRTPPYEQVECHVLCNGDATTTANDPTNKCTIVFATAPANNATGQYKVTVIG